MTLNADLARLRPSQFVALILDNEVTVGEFVTTTPLSWVRIVQRHGIFQVAEGYPRVLTAAQAKFEMKNWDEVSLPAITFALAELAEAVDYLVIGNNAGQGLPLAEAVPRTVIESRAAIIYATRLPEMSAYEQLGYRTFFRRSETSPRLLTLAEDSARPLAYYFLNTIQHNPMNYHDP
jgi:hypothetical protein